MINKLTLKLVKIVVMVLMLAFAAFFAFIGYNIHEFRKINTKSIIELKKGDGLSRLAHKLDRANVIYDKTLFKIYAVGMGFDKSLQPGEYLLNSTMSEKQILDKISKGKVFYRKITIPEGLNIKEITQIINGNDFLSGDIALKIKEGFLLPETYYFRKGESKDDLLKQMQSAMIKAIDLAWNNRDKK